MDAPSRRSRVVTCVGDSLTRGDGSHLGGPIPKRIAEFGNYPAELQLELGTADWQVSNHGKGGATAIASGQSRACLGPTLAGGTLGYAATKEFREALRLRPNFVDALDSRGLMNLKGGQNKNAIADFDAALKINPRLTSSLYGRGLAKKRNGAVAEGDLDIANAKAMDPNIVKEFADYGVQ